MIGDYARVDEANGKAADLSAKVQFIVVDRALVLTIERREPCDAIQRDDTASADDFDSARDRGRAREAATYALDGKVCDAKED